MTAYSRKALFWAPRVLCMAFILFVSLFALDVFGEGRGLWETLVALMMHLVPTYILIGMLAIAWRRGWFGALVSTALGLLFLWWHHGHRPNDWFAIVFLAGPLFLMAALFLLSWLKRAELRAGA